MHFVEAEPVGFRSRILGHGPVFQWISHGPLSAPISRIRASIQRRTIRSWRAIASIDFVSVFLYSEHSLVGRSLPPMRLFSFRLRVRLPAGYL